MKRYYYRTKRFLRTLRTKLKEIYMGFMAVVTLTMILAVVAWVLFGAVMLLTNIMGALR